MGFLAAAGIASAAASAYGAYSANKAGKAAAAQAKSAQKAQSEQLAMQQAALQELFANQPDPAEVFAEIFSSMPGLLDQVLPRMRGQAQETASQFTDFNLTQRDKVLDAIFGKGVVSDLYSRRADIINDLDPANLGQNEILAQTRMLSPLIPEGTLNPSNGAVQGGTTSPVSLYRRFISDKYDERRGLYLQQNSAFTQEAENTALRQQERAGDYLNSFLNLAGNAAGSLTSQTISQYQGNIQAQAGLLNTVLGMGTPTVDLSSYSSATTQGITDAIGSLAGAYKAYTYKSPTAVSANAGVNSAVAATAATKSTTPSASLRGL